MRAFHIKILPVLLTGMFCILHSPGASAQPRDLAKWMRGKELKIVVPFRAGGGNDLAARIIARTGSKYFPGKPQIRVVNRPGGGGLRGIRYTYKQPNDGLTSGLLHPRFILRPMIGIKIQGFDPSKIRLVANVFAGKSGQYLCVRRTVATSWQQVLALKRSITFGDSGYGTSGGAGALFLQLTGAPVKVVTGYGGTSGIIAALDRGELDSGRACLIGKGDTIERLHPEWLKRPTYLVPIAYYGAKPDKARLDELGLKVPPLLFDLAGVKYTKGQREAFELNDRLVAVGNHSLWLPPGVPDDMFNAWHGMLEHLKTDPKFNELSEAGNEETGYISGTDLEKLIGRAKHLPPDGTAMLKSLNTGKSLHVAQ